MPDSSRKPSLHRAAESVAPRYAQIVGDLRTRITSGRLKPGDRVPSTRQICRDCDVALATATKALSALRQEGLIRSVPRSGYVVSEARPARGPIDRDPLSKERIVGAAIALADENGLEALSMRGVAGRLGVPPMSIYRYVESKDALVLWMIDAAFGEVPPMPPSGANLRDDLLRAARAQWSLYRRHGWLAHTMSLTRPVALPNVIQHAEWILRAIDGPGLDAATKLHAHMTLYNYVRGVAFNLESEREAEAATGVTDDEWTDAHGDTFRALATEGNHSAFAALLDEMAAGYDMDLDVVFEFGLQPIVDGLVRILR